jgi:hypothetical protein
MFEMKVGIIIEILIRKCGFGSVDMAVPHKYKGFVKAVAEVCSFFHYFVALYIKKIGYNNNNKDFNPK